MIPIIKIVDFEQDFANSLQHQKEELSKEISKVTTRSESKNSLYKGKNEPVLKISNFSACTGCIEHLFAFLFR